MLWLPIGAADLGTLRSWTKEKAPRGGSWKSFGQSSTLNIYIYYLKGKPNFSFSNIYSVCGWLSISGFFRFAEDLPVYLFVSPFFFFFRSFLTFAKLLYNGIEWV